MKIRTVLKPGKRGTKALVNEYGSQLICVRYRYDYIKKKKYKTVELVVKEEFWEPVLPHPDEERPKVVDKGYSQDSRVKIRIDFNETTLQKKIKSYGGLWSRKEQVWFVDESVVREAGLGHRIVD